MLGATKHTHYVYLDIVDFTKDRHVEAQADIVSALNNIVASSVTSLNLPEENRIFIPTGDGICIALLDVPSPYDADIRIALSILKGIDEHNKKTEDETRKFKVRIGINSNTDNLIIDINGNRNLAGAGINTAARVMSMADGNQILIGESVFNTLSKREPYISAFRYFLATVKHDEKLPLYQFVADNYRGLNTDIPAAFQVKSGAPSLSKIVAYYFAYSIRHKDLLFERLEQLDEQTGITLLWLLALSSDKNSESMKVHKIYEPQAAFIEDQFKYCSSLERDVKYLLAELICSEYLRQYDENFEPKGAFKYLFINSKGKKKLAGEWRIIWEEFELYRYL